MNHVFLLLASTFLLSFIGSAHVKRTVPIGLRGTEIPKSHTLVSQVQQTRNDTESRKTQLRRLKKLEKLTTNAQGVSLLKVKMRLFVRLVKASVLDSRSDATGFSWLIAQLYGQLRTIYYLADLFAPLKEKDLAQMHYATYVYHLVDESASLLWLYSSKSGPAQKGVCRMVRLNLRLLHFFDSHGKPRLKQKNYKLMVIRFANEKKNWERVFYRLKNVPVATCLDFDIQLSRANESLRSLASRIPGFAI